MPEGVARLPPRFSRSGSRANSHTRRPWTRVERRELRGFRRYRDVSLPVGFACPNRTRAMAAPPCSPGYKAIRIAPAFSSHPSTVIAVAPIEDDDRPRVPAATVRTSSRSARFSARFRGPLPTRPCSASADVLALVRRSKPTITTTASAALAAASALITSALVSWMTLIAPRGSGCPSTTATASGGRPGCCRGPRGSARGEPADDRDRLQGGRDREAAAAASFFSRTIAFRATSSARARCVGLSTRSPDRAAGDRRRCRRTSSRRSRRRRPRRSPPSGTAPF